MGNYIFWTFMWPWWLCSASALSCSCAPTRTVRRPRRYFSSHEWERRLEIVEHASLDGRRKLVLIRRDDVEHLLMTGGPVDVVVETGISTGAQIR